MSLFLNAAIQEVQSTYSPSGLKEAYSDIIELVTDFTSINESILQKDFNIHISENVTVEDEELFLSESMESIKAFILRARDKIVNFFRQLAFRINSVWKDFTRKYPELPTTLPSQVYPAGFIEVVNSLIISLNNLASSINDTSKSYSDYKKHNSALMSKATIEVQTGYSKLKDLRAKYNTRYKAYYTQKAKTDNATTSTFNVKPEMEYVNGALVQLIRQSGNNLSVLADTSYRALTTGSNQITQLESEIEKSDKKILFSNNSKKKQNIEELKKLQEQARLWLSMTSLTTKLHIMINAI